MDCSLPGSSIHGIFQARVLEWGAIGRIDKSVKTERKVVSDPRKAGSRENGNNH